MSAKRFALAVLACSAIALPLSATPLTWTFDDSSPTSTGSAGIHFADGSVLAGSFTFDADIGALGTFSGLSVTTAGGSVVPVGSNWFINQRPDDCCSDSFAVFLVSADPSVFPDLTNVNGQPAFSIPLNLISGMTSAGGISTINFSDGTFGPEEGPCFDAECGFISANNLAATTFLLDTNAHIWATADIGPGDAPEPSTFILGGSVLLALGSFRRRKSATR